MKNPPEAGAPTSQVGRPRIPTAQYRPDPHVAGLGTRFPYDGEPEWTVDLQTDGRVRHQPVGQIGEIKRATAAGLAKQLTAHSAGTFPSMPTVAAVAEQFLKDGKPRWAVATYKANRRAVKNFGNLLDTSISEVNREAACAWHFSHRCDRDLSVLSQLMRYAQERGLIPQGRNPCKGLRKKQRTFKAIYPTEADYRQAGPALKKKLETQPLHATAVLLIALTGARRSEILDLCWNQILDRGAYVQESKTGPRFVVFCPSAIQLLSRIPKDSSANHVLRRDDGTRIGDWELADFWRRFKQETRLPKPMRIHDLRHGFASVGINHGEELAVVGELLGHQDFDSTLCYAHLATQTSRTDSEKAASRLRAQLSGGRVADPDKTSVDIPTDPEA